MHVTCVADARLVPPRWPSPGEDPQRALPPGRHKAPMAAVSRAELSRSGSLSWVQAFRGTPTRCATRFLPDCRVDGRPPPATASSRRWGHTQAKSEPRTPRTEQESCIIESGRPGLLARRARVRLRRTAGRRLAGAAGLGVVARAAGRADPRGQLLRRDRRRREGTCCCRAPRDAGTRNRPGHRC